MNKRKPIFAFLLLGAAACGDDGATHAATGGCPGASAPGVPGQIAVAKCLTADARSQRLQQASAPSPVVLFIDRSLSMRGFLNPAYPTREPSDFRTVLDRLTVQFQPAGAFSYGLGVRRVPGSLSVLANGGFYTDRDTQMEEALELIGRDTALRASYLIVGDGRRGAPTVAIAQFDSMRAVGARWLAKGGSFVVAASMAPFETVREDPSGCRRGPASSGNSRCPLYAFGFARPGQQLAVVTMLASAFQHVFSWPAVQVPSTALGVELVGAPVAGLQVHPTWSAASDGTPIARVSGTMRSTGFSELRVVAHTNEASADQLWNDLLRDEGVANAVDARALVVDALRAPWQPVAGIASTVQASNAPGTVRVASKGPTGPAALFRLQVLASGEPAWLSDYDAANAADTLRTFGLGRLFSGFVAQARSTPQDERTVARVFLVVN